LYIYTVKNPPYMNNENVRRFILLQERANRMIDTYGQCTNEVAEELEYLCNILTPQEMDVVCLWARNQSDYYSNCEY
jgi:hypothetical protein